MRLIIVSGLSGSGKSVALHMLEDLDFYCIDNVPVTLLGSMLEQLTGSDDPTYANLAVGVDARNRAADLNKIPELFKSLSDSGLTMEVIYLHADTDMILRRYRETRRKHPLRNNGMSMQEAIELERKLLGPISNSSDLVIDTTQTSVYELRELIRERVGRRDESEISLMVESFGFKHGVPFDADFVFDVRCLPNPYWEIPLRPLNGRDPEVIEFLEDDPAVRTMIQDILGFLRHRIPEFIEARRNYMTVAIGCTGGQHRSVYVVDRITAALKEEFQHVLTRHNELAHSGTRKSESNQA